MHPPRIIPVPKKKPLRADAERNRQRVLEVAQAVFASEGLSVAIDEIARRAELGVGTLYRHFPTKEALFLAIVVDRMEHLIEEAEERAEAEDPGEALFGFLALLAKEGAAKRDFMDALSATNADVGRTLASMKSDLRAAMTVLVEKAQKAGRVRPDVGVHEVMALMTGAFAAMERMEPGAKGRERLLAIVCDGLRQRET
jgi:AcrR family transcriptional regulator